MPYVLYYDTMIGKKVKRFYYVQAKRLGQPWTTTKDLRNAFRTRTKARAEEALLAIPPEHGFNCLKVVSSADAVRMHSKVALELVFDDEVVYVAYHGYRTEVVAHIRDGQLFMRYDLHDDKFRKPVTLAEYVQLIQQKISKRKIV